MYETNVELEKGDAMEDVDGKLELSPAKESATSVKPRDEDIKVKSPTQLSATCKSPSLIARSDRFPLVDLSNTLNYPICTSLPPKPSWTRINLILSETEEKLEVFIGKKRVSPPKKNQ